MIHITDSITINDDQIDFKAVRSSGPGGQHVNMDHGLFKKFVSLR